MFTRKNAVMSITSALVVLSLTVWVSAAHAEAKMKPGKVFKGVKKAEELPKGYVKQGGLTWMPVSNTTYTYDQASSLCGGTINGQSGWRLPTYDELVALYNSGAMKDQGWRLDSTWSSMAYGSSGIHFVVSLHNGNAFQNLDTIDNCVTCVR